MYFYGGEITGSWIMIDEFFELYIATHKKNIQKATHISIQEMLVVEDSYLIKTKLGNIFNPKPRTTLSQDVQTWFSVQLAFAKFLSRIKEIFLIHCQYHGYSIHSKSSLYFR